MKKIIVSILAFLFLILLSSFATALTEQYLDTPDDFIPIGGLLGLGGNYEVCMIFNVSNHNFTVKNVSIYSSAIAGAQGEVYYSFYNVSTVDGKPDKRISDFTSMNTVMGTGWTANITFNTTSSFNGTADTRYGLCFLANSAAAQGARWDFKTGGSYKGGGDWGCYRGNLGVGFTCAATDWHFLFMINYEDTISGGGGGSSSTLNITASGSIPTGSQYPYNTLNFNASANTTDLMNCSLYINNTINLTQYNLPAGNNILTNFTQTFADGVYSYFINCVNNNSGNANTSTNTFTIDLVQFNNITFNNYIPYGSYNYTRGYINFTYNYFCNSMVSSYLWLKVNNSMTSTYYNLTCDNTTKSQKGSYYYGTEGLYNLSFYFNNTWTSSDNQWIGNSSWMNDLNNPTINYLNFSIQEGFSNGLSNISINCSDTIWNQTTYYLMLNNNLLYNNNLSNNQLYVNQSGFIHGLNTIIGKCSDLFGQTNQTLIDNIYFRQISIINERTNELFNVNNVSSLIIYYDDNSTSFDFQAQNTNVTNFTSLGQEKLRLEIVYANGEVITRWIDVTLSDEPLRICANTDPTTYYEQLAISALVKAVTIKSVYSNCVIAEDYTRFAYQNSNALKAFTIPTLYYLYTYDSDGDKVYLASMDGSISTYYNLDVLEFNQNSHDVEISRQSLSYEKVTGGIEIYFINLNNDSITTNIKITSMNSSVTYLDTDETTSPNEFYLLFDYTTLGLANSTILKIEVTTEDIDGNTETYIEYFNMEGHAGRISAGLALAVAILMTVFGLTFLIPRFSLGWFGLIVELAVLAVLSMAVQTWYIMFFEAMTVVILIFMFMLSFGIKQGDIPT